jgi:hypothetical protein
MDAEHQIRRSRRSPIAPIVSPEPRAHSPSRAVNRLSGRSSTVTMTVEDPGEQDTPVDLDKLKASLGCPLCQGVYRFPVTVVRWTRGANARDARAFLPSIVGR